METIMKWLARSPEATLLSRIQWEIIGGIAAGCVLLLGAFDVSAGGEKEPSGIERHALFELAGASERFDGQGVEVFGFLRYTSMLRLYLTSDHARFADIGSAIVVIDSTPAASIIQSPCESSYVHVKGVMGKVDNGPLGIVSVKEIRAADSNEICWKREE
jgi:hypothetical protein